VVKQVSQKEEGYIGAVIPSKPACTIQRTVRMVTAVRPIRVRFVIGGGYSSIHDNPRVYNNIGVCSRNEVGDPCAYDIDCAAKGGMCIFGFGDSNSQVCGVCATVGDQPGQVCNKDEGHLSCTNSVLRNTTHSIHGGKAGDACEVDEECDDGVCAGPWHNGTCVYFPEKAKPGEFCRFSHNSDNCGDKTDKNAPPSYCRLFNSDYAWASKPKMRLLSNVSYGVCTQDRVDPNHGLYYRRV
jgi:hypothetical protein